MPYARSAKYLVVCAGMLCACAKEAPLVELKGECGGVFNAQVCTWARTRGSEVVDAGALVPLASIENAPKDVEMVWPPAAAAKLMLPEAVREKTGFTELTMFWEAMGHPPGPYLTPHFDFHFYLVPPAEQQAIDCADLGKPAALPSGYSLPDVPLPPPLVKMTGVGSLVGLCVPTMGMHALPGTDLESKDALRGSMVIGYYHSKPIFVEPMLSRAMLLEKRSFELAIPSIPGVAGPYPHGFHAEYDAQQNAYRFVFADFRANQ